MFSAGPLNLVASLHDRFRAMRAYRVWGVLVLGALMSFVPSQTVEAGHCGRAGYLPEWNQSQMAWEGSLGVADAGDAWRVKGRGCDGPMCQSRTPEPLTPQSSGSGLTAPMPWRCTALVFGLKQDVLDSGVAGFEAMMPESPVLEELFKPPRCV